MYEWLLIVTGTFVVSYPPILGFANSEDCHRAGQVIFKMNYTEEHRTARPDCTKLDEEGFTSY